MAEERISLNFKLPKSIHLKLIELARADQRSMTAMVIRLIDQETVRREKEERKG